MTIEETIGRAKKLHFIGVGGSGIFPIVQIMLGKGYEISGSDNNEGDTLEQERQLGVRVFLGHKAEQVAGADAVIYSAAIMQDNPELLAARAAGIPTFERSEMLGYITRQYDNCICVSGTHGKTTTTAMLTQILMGAGLDPTAVIGGKLPLIDGSGRAGTTDIMTCEACEYVDTFLHLSPDYAVILNVDEDHMEYFGTLERIVQSFHQFAALATKGVIVNADDANSLKAVAGISVPLTTFGFGETCDYRADNIQVLAPARTGFDLVCRGEKLTRVELQVAGRHNILNALAALAAAHLVGAQPQKMRDALAGFGGAGRRFERLGEVNGVTVADDYAHHPAELSVTLQVAKTMGYNRVWAVFQPFTYSRTALLLNDFAAALAIADKVVMSEIMGAREVNTYGIYTKDLAALVPGSVWFNGFDEIAEYVLANAQPGDLVLTLGCGDIYKCAKMMLKNRQ